MKNSKINKSTVTLFLGSTNSQNKVFLFFREEVKKEKKNSHAHILQKTTYYEIYIIPKHKYKKKKKKKKIKLGFQITKLLIFY